MRLVLMIFATMILAACSNGGGSEFPHCEMMITEPGTYTLDRDISADVCAIGILASDVQLDLNGHKLTGPARIDVPTYGVLSLGQSNVEVFNGLIEGFGWGVRLGTDEFGGDAVSNLTAHHLTIDRSGYIGINLEGAWSTAHDNVITNVGGGSFQSLKYVYGISVTGRSCYILRNQIREVYPDRPTAEGVAISLTLNNSGCVLEKNDLSNSTPVTTKNTFGFWVDVYSRAALRENKVRGFHYSGVIPEFSEMTNNDLDVPFIHVITDR